MSKTQTDQTTAPTAEAFWVTGAATGEIRQTPLAPEYATDTPMVEVETHYSGVSRGTESLVFLNKVPASECQRMRAPFQAGEFPYPVRHGYANVGKVMSGPASLVGNMVFCLYSHQTRYRVPADAVIPLPDNVPAHRAVLAANMETAVNGLWDASPRVGDRIAVVGRGVVGTLMAYLASKIPGTRVTAVDVNAERLPLLDSLGVRFMTQTELQDHDLVIHASGHPAGLVSALALAGQEARIIEMSWFGDQDVSLPLGQSFHARRLTLRSSQVGSINPSQAPRWQYRDRLALALSLLADPALDALISGESGFEQLPETMAMLSQAGSSELCHRIVYPPAIPTD
jgi:threonine dehydrogenase-like Zn-dependent dehydrogenase